MRKLITACCLLVLGLSACKKEKLDPDGTGAERLANEWWVTLTQGGNDIFGIGHFKIASYNTAANSDSIWLDDLKHGYGFKSKVAADFSGSTFGRANAVNLYYNPANPPAFPATVSFTGGKVIAQAGRSRTGNATDSIYVELEFSDDPGTKYVLSGHARTAFAEDEY
jgi:hypothetical protein